MTKIINRKHGDKEATARAIFKGACKLQLVQHTLSVYASQYATRQLNGTVNANKFIEANQANPKCELESAIFKASQNNKSKIGEAWARVQSLAIASAVTGQDSHDLLMLECDSAVLAAMSTAKAKAPAKKMNALNDALALVIADVEKLTLAQRQSIVNALGFDYTIAA
jgi:hypothetical protein